MPNGARTIVIKILLSNMILVWIIDTSSVFLMDLSWALKKQVTETVVRTDSLVTTLD